MSAVCFHNSVDVSLKARLHDLSAPLAYPGPYSHSTSNLRLKLYFFDATLGLMRNRGNRLVTSRILLE